MTAPQIEHLIQKIRILQQCLEKNTADIAHRFEVVSASPHPGGILSDAPTRLRMTKGGKDMPGSFGVFDDVVNELVGLIKPQTFLDIGTGSGKYGKLVRSAAPKCNRTGIEIEASYIERFGAVSRDQEH